MEPLDFNHFVLHVRMAKKGTTTTHPIVGDEMRALGQGTRCEVWPAAKLTPHQRQEALARLEAGETQADVARTYNVDATTIVRLQPSPFEEAAAAAA